MNSSVTISTNIKPTPPPPPPPHPSHGFLPLLHHRTPLLPHPLLPYKPKQKLPHSFPHFHHRTPEPFSPLPCAAKPHKPNPRKKRDPSFSAATPRTTTTPPCTECGKSFSSWKALFGHMRCHPERQWRGINPPPHLRRIAAARCFTDEEYEVASSLLMLSRGPPKGGAAAPGEEARCGQKYNAFSQGVSTSQTLGGHKRSYWEKGGREDSGAGCSSRRYNLDVNSLPPLESNEGNANSVLDLRLGI